MDSLHFEGTALIHSVSQGKTGLRLGSHHLVSLTLQKGVAERVGDLSDVLQILLEGVNGIGQFLGVIHVTRGGDFFERDGAILLILNLSLIHLVL